MKKKFSLLTLVCVCTILSACGSEKNANTKVSIETEQKTVVKNTSKTEEPIQDPYADVSDKVLHLLNIGTYEGNIAFNGGDRDEKTITLEDNSLLFPQCSIRTIIGNTVGTTPFFVDVDKSEVTKLIDMIEKTEIRVVEGDETKILNKKNCITAEEFPVSAELQLVFLNSASEYQYVHITAFKSDTVNIYVENNETEYCLMPNEALTEQIKKFTNYRIIDKDELKNIHSMQLTNTKKNQTYTLSKEEIHSFVTSMESAKQIEEFHSSLIDIVATMEDGDVIQMKFDNRSKELAIEGSVYTVSEDTVNALVR